MTGTLFTPTAKPYSEWSVVMISQLIARAKQWAGRQGQPLRERGLGWTQPVNYSPVVGLLQELRRQKTDLLLENALLRQQLIVLQRQVRRPTLSGWDRVLMVVLSSKVQSWKQALVIIQPETVLRWHRELFKWVWRREAKPRGHRLPVSAAPIRLI